MREVEDGPVEALKEWAIGQQNVFHVPNAAEGAYVAQIYGVAHFQQNIEQQKLLKGWRNADPFVIAKAAIEERCVVTMERFKGSSTKIPNFCHHFGIQCMSLEEFMEQEGWQF